MVMVMMMIDHVRHRPMAFQTAWQMRIIRVPPTCTRMDIPNEIPRP
jgi:hypothetical protein